MVYSPGNVRDVPPATFIKAYAAHLKANDQARGWCRRGCRPGLAGLSWAERRGARRSSCPPGWTP